VTPGPTPRQQRIQAIRAGASECLSLPIDAEEFALRLEAMVAAKRDADHARDLGLVDQATGLYNARGFARRALELGSYAYRRSAASPASPSDSAPVTTQYPISVRLRSTPPGCSSAPPARSRRLRPIPREIGFARSSRPAPASPPSARRRASLRRREDALALTRRLFLPQLVALREIRVTAVGAVLPDIVQHRPQQPNRQAVQRVELRGGKLTIGDPRAQHQQQIARQGPQDVGVDTDRQRRAVDQDHLKARPETGEQPRHLPGAQELGAQRRARAAPDEREARVGSRLQDRVERRALGEPI